MAAIVLSFYDFEAEVVDLLQKMSKNSRVYYRAHVEVLQAFLVSMPELHKMPPFSHSKLKQVDNM